MANLVFSERNEKAKSKHLARITAALNILQQEGEWLSYQFY